VAILAIVVGVAGVVQGGAAVADGGRPGPFGHSGAGPESVVLSKIHVTSTGTAAGTEVAATFRAANLTSKPVGSTKVFLVLTPGDKVHRASVISLVKDKIGSLGPRAKTNVTLTGTTGSAVPAGTYQAQVCPIKVKNEFCYPVKHAGQVTIAPAALSLTPPGGVAQPLGPGSSQTYTVANTGQAWTGAVHVALAGDTTDFSEQSACPTDTVGLAPTQTCTVTVTYAAVPTGNQPTTLTVSADHATAVSAAVVGQPPMMRPPADRRG
jgi:hypothetical protein